MRTAVERLAGQHLLVTGAGRGLGRAIALASAAAGADVTLAGRTAADLEAVAREVRAFGRRAVAVVADVSTEAGAERAVSAALEDIGPLDVIVNAASVTCAAGTVADMPLAEWQQAIATNLSGAFLVTRAALGLLMARRSGAIVFLSSSASERGEPGAAAWAASSQGLLGLAASLSAELRGLHVRVLAVATEPPRAGEPAAPAHLDAARVGETVVAALALPPRPLVRGVELWGAAL